MTACLPKCQDWSKTLRGFGGTGRVLRAGQGVYLKGRYTAGAETEISMPLSIQPLTGRQQELLPENVRTRRSMLVFAGEELRTASPDGQTIADVVLYKDRRFEVFNVKDWSDFGGFWEAVVVEQGTG